MVDVEYSRSFDKAIRKIRDAALKDNVKSQIVKIITAPEIGKPLRYNLKGERTLYVKPYRIIYSYNNDLISFLVFEHRDDVYG
jgi:mRNA-degrading endonuclease RelE of RelBE toxin-antitoxin system